MTSLVPVFWLDAKQLFGERFIVKINNTKTIGLQTIFLKLMHQIKNWSKNLIKLGTLCKMCRIIL